MTLIERMPTFWPRWIPIATSGSVLNNFWRGGPNFIGALGEDLLYDHQQTRILQMFSENFWGWTVHTHFISTDEVLVTFACSAGSGTVNRTNDFSELLLARSPTCFLDGDGMLYLVGLNWISQSGYSSGYVSLDFPDPEGDIWVRNDDTILDVFHRLPSSSSLRDSGGFYFLGNYTAQYPSLRWANSLDTSGTVSINGEAPLTISKWQIDTYLDNFGYAYDTPRLPRESNTTYRQVLSAYHHFNPTCTIDGIIQNIAINLRLFSTISGPLSGTIDVSGFNSWSVIFPNVSQFSSRNLVLRFNNDFSSYIFPRIPDSYCIPYGSSTITASTSGFLFTVREDPTIDSDLNVRMRWANYVLSKGSSGQITSVTFASGVIAPEAWITQGIRVVPTLQYPGLFSINMEPSSQLEEIIDIIFNRVPDILGNSSWDRLTWFRSQDTSPATEYVPRLLIG